MEPLAVPRQHHAEGGLAEIDRLFQDRVEHWGEVAGRGVDDLQYLGGRGLLLQGPRVSVRSRAFSIAMTACAAKFCNSAICLSVNGRSS